MFSKGVSYGGFLAVAVLGVAYFYSDSEVTLNRFGEAVSEKLCEHLPIKEAATEAAATSEATATTTSKVTKESIFNPKVTNGAVYNAKKAMDARYNNLKEVCHKYTDVLRPESIVGLQVCA
jgi:hypothetical protein